jgi:asparagine synthase (glutamine-hydrolysing)
MCGIAGLLGVPWDLAQEAAPRMLAAMRHRGPDDLGMEVIQNPQAPNRPVVLLHTRLAILDLTSAGHQPMSDRPVQTPTASAARQKPNWIVFNGEIFNFQNLYPELAGAGWPPRTRCDTEVILHAYRLWRTACVEKFRGMFTWCLVDAERETAWFCRDRLGVKPLYLARPRCGGLLFASEVRTLLAAGPELVPPVVDPGALESFLAQGSIGGAGTIIHGIESFEAGQSLVTDWLGRSLKSQRYWKLPFVTAEETTQCTARTDAVAQLAATLRQAVKMRLLADVPLGLFLSGGVDSSALATVASEQADTLRTVSIGFDQPEFDETLRAGEVARTLHTVHSSLRLTGADILDAFPQALAAVDQPTVDGFNTYFVSQATRRAGLKVALSGLGGDELFGGYASFRDVPRAVRWRRGLKRFGLIRRGLAGLASRVGGRSIAKAAEALKRKPSFLQMYFLRRELFLPGERRALHPLPEGCDPYTGMPRSFMDDLADDARGLDSVNQVSLFELSAYMRNMLLRDADVFSMAHGLELRVPLLDHRLVEQTVQMPGALKRPDPRPKPLLLDAVGSRLPQSVHRHPKQGFTFPWSAWLRGPMKERADRALQNRDVWTSLGMNPAEPLGLWQRFLRGDRRLSALQILALMVLEDFTIRHGLSIG